ncbi:hypothetical protein METBIDRAFT_195825 [Metschnikowia bicuspidata var. bicuspidata NRRL YB-4993]|uniref:Uncharacterized protein n=1 Tax=Metschnikowia bicuspidata var. bicuspidata NRRL YB-4993 TaxID=869754 RepID=A0A1A0H8H9_9ASCO|nr:hypothetical protein METBIDRAFT_195825 [Metschnikowia bicuspidata var. bicuspidata NRRL YB-4993]OBA20295.1 hypothetical protein METBIDRAFT_195825 [Metschnikowia bicuspidata var. bicuspidata NRRL YB-4993]
MDTTVNVAMLPIANPDESGWQVQGRKRRNSRTRTGKKTDMWMLIGMTSSEKWFALRSENAVPESVLFNNPYLVLADIDENDYQEPRPSRTYTKVPEKLELSSLGNVISGCSLIMVLTMDSYEVLNLNVVTNIMDKARESDDEKDLGIFHESTQNLTKDLPTDLGMGSTLASKQVGTIAKMPDIPETDIDDHGWKVQGRKHRNCRKRPQPTVSGAESLATPPTDPKCTLGPKPEMKSLYSQNPYLVLAEIGDDELHGSPPRRRV